MVARCRSTFPRASFHKVQEHLDASRMHLHVERGRWRSTSALFAWHGRRRALAGDLGCWHRHPNLREKDESIHHRQVRGQKKWAEPQAQLPLHSGAREMKLDAIVGAALSGRAKPGFRGRAGGGHDGPSWLSSRGPAGVPGQLKDRLLKQEPMLREAQSSRCRLFASQGRFCCWRRGHDETVHVLGAEECGHVSDHLARKPRQPIAWQGSFDFAGAIQGAEKEPVGAAFLFYVDVQAEVRGQKQDIVHHLIVSVEGFAEWSFRLHRRRQGQRKVQQLVDAVPSRAQGAFEAVHRQRHDHAQARVSEDPRQRWRFRYGSWLLPDPLTSTQLQKEVWMDVEHDAFHTDMCLAVDEPLRSGLSGRAVADGLKAAVDLAHAYATASLGGHLPQASHWPEGRVAEADT
mmetsp:Transcript_17868/g.67811  ORF Transcript_17868/g.67811 Transcript_17868/m.67811 type:complete len:403 (+) Transcript_17868:631-1839(+)